MKIAIVARDNGVGIDKDRMVLENCLSPFYQITHCNMGKPYDRPKGDIRIFLEEIEGKYMGRTNFFIPNQDGFIKRRYMRLFPRINLILTKTQYATKLFKQIHSNVRYIGFTSLDYQILGSKKYQFFHSQGRSEAKQSQAILDAWLPEYPNLLFISSQHSPKTPQANIRAIDHFVDRQDYIQMLNESLISLCPSNREGFGHYIHEAKSASSVVLTTNAPPMNEFIKQFLCKPDNIVESRLTLDNYWNVSVDSLRDTINEVIATPITQLIEIGKQNRKDYLLDKINYEKQLLTVFKEYENIPTKSNTSKIQRQWILPKSRTFN